MSSTTNSMQSEFICEKNSYVQGVKAPLPVSNSLSLFPFSSSPSLSLPLSLSTAHSLSFALSLTLGCILTCLCTYQVVCQRKPMFQEQRCINYITNFTQTGNLDRDKKNITISLLGLSAPVLWHRSCTCLGGHGNSSGQV